MLVIAEFTSDVWASVPVAELKVIVLKGFTTILPFAVPEPEPPVKVTV